VIKVGIERVNDYLDLFENKKVGLITNPTGVDSNFKSTINILNDLTNLVALYSPEHGVRGDLQAGVRLDDYVDLQTGCKVFSLYGKNKKPTYEMVKDIDILCFDIQDVGARFYTYIYTLAYVMMASKEFNKEVIVFDRPNPVGGIEVEGNILDVNFRSFVGYYPLVQRYGLTIGELATLFNQEYGINCKLKVIKMANYKRTMYFEDTGQPFVMPSPNIPTSDSTLAYLTTCIFEGTNMSEGRGTTKPFSIIGAPWLNVDELLNKLGKEELSGVEFRKIFFTPTFSKHSGELCNGIEMYITNKDIFKPIKIGYILIYFIKESNKEFDYIKPYKEGMNPMINLLTGDDFLRENKLSLSELLDKINKDSEVFKSMKERYHLYE
jgi:uncharacterized protein YbbC (DUF1343 family)